MTFPVGIAVVSLVLLVIFSYIQTILHYPGGGGAYMVTKDNLGTIPSLFAAAALLTDYVLTVSVSTSAGVRAITSAFPGAFHFRIEIAILSILLITWINLRGVRESGSIFAIPTYAFIGGVLIIILTGLVRYFGVFGAPALEISHVVIPAQSSASGFLYVWIILRAFAGGCTALTGIEAISDGVQAFKPPESKNAAITMLAMGITAMSLFVGILFLATHMGLIPNETESILSQMTRRIVGTGFMYYWVQIFTAMILFLAANTGYQDFPRLSSFLAMDSFVPRWLQNRGDRLVYSSGIVVLAIVSSLMVIVFRADEIAMLPLYALGVMLSFSLSQFGMFRLMGKISHLKPGESIHTKVTKIHYEKHVQWKRLLNAVGAIVTFIVFLILLTTKFKEGAWVVAFAIPLIMGAFYTVHRHYNHIAAALSTVGLTEDSVNEVADVVIVPVADIHRGTLLALTYAKRISRDVRAITVVTSPQMKERFLTRWNRFPLITKDLTLSLIEYDFRDILIPLVDYIEHVNDVEFCDKITTVVVPEFIPEKKYANILHNQTANRLRSRLIDRKDIVIIEVPFHIDSQLEKIACQSDQENPLANPKPNKAVPVSDSALGTAQNEP
jgi:amino acid transporter